MNQLGCISTQSVCGLGFEPVGDPSSCGSDEGQALVPASITYTTLSECGDACRANPGCKHYTLCPATGQCSLKSGESRTVEKHGSAANGCQMYFDDEQAPTRSYAASFLRTGCPNPNPTTLSHWETLSATAAFNDMYAYCNVNANGGATTAQSNNCCGTGQTCTPTCIQQTGDSCWVVHC